VTGGGKLRFRLWVAGKIAAEEWVIYADDEQAGDMGHVVGARHAHLAEQAETDGKLWLLEVWNPGLPEDQAYIRYGTDKAGLTDPVPLPHEPGP